MKDKCIIAQNNNTTWILESCNSNNLILIAFHLRQYHYFTVYKNSTYFVLCKNPLIWMVLINIKMIKNWWKKGYSARTAIIYLIFLYTTWNWILMKDTFCVPLWNTANQDTILSHLHWFYQQMITSLQQHQGKCALCTEIVGPALDLDMICTLENSENKNKLWVLLCKIPRFVTKHVQSKQHCYVPNIMSHWFRAPSFIYYSVCSPYWRKPQRITVP